MKNDISYNVNELSKKMGEIKKGEIKKGEIKNSNFSTKAIANWLNNGSYEKIRQNGHEVAKMLRRMESGEEILGGKTTLGLKEIGKWKINPKYYYQNVRQQSGYAAEVISTAKENIKNILKKNGITTVRADDMPKLFGKNNQFVDKVRIKDGKIIERIQTKFIGKNPKECLNKLASKKCEKYISSGK